MRLLNLKNLKTRFAPHAAQPRDSSADSQIYRLTVIAQSSELNNLVDLFVTELATAAVVPRDIRHEENERTHRIKIVATVACTPAQRAALVRFVHQAGILPGVRGVKWESVPPTESIVLH
ncbi:hypothetical protein [Noviherbaspirillum pedocola]|uniref:MgtC-like C-terminal domain-containing protein n=1 Tax=Noviherbaspirillum pedocola TaxID=2801341 RepID=A0A934SYX3_9BURK|nr:hypothetical protein [Noviherbaspirillum pedocola]MBK4737855.1 hypothetical protein [Noviherbaspirillum pedocola]